jgi:hypothetical protein
MCKNGFNAIFLSSRKSSFESWEEEELEKKFLSVGYKCYLSPKVCDKLFWKCVCNSYKNPVASFYNMSSHPENIWHLEKRLTPTEEVDTYERSWHLRKKLTPTEEVDT